MAYEAALSAFGLSWVGQAIPSASGTSTTVRPLSVFGHIGSADTLVMDPPKNSLGEPSHEMVQKGLEPVELPLVLLDLLILGPYALKQI